MTNVSKREFLAASIGAGLSLSAMRKALAQQKKALARAGLKVQRQREITNSPRGR